MTKANKTRKFAQVKRMLAPKALKQYKDDVLNPKRKDTSVDKLPRNVPNTSAALFFKHNSALGPQYQVQARWSDSDHFKGLSRACSGRCMLDSSSGVRKIASHVRVLFLGKSLRALHVKHSTVHSTVPQPEEVQLRPIFCNSYQGV